MAVMRAVGVGHRVPAHARVREDEHEYVVELDVSDFLERELAVEVVGPRVTVRGIQVEERNEGTVAFRLQERLDESFRLPDDADPDRLKAFFAHGTLELCVPRRPSEPRSVPIERRSPFVCNPDAAPC